MQPRICGISAYFNQRKSAEKKFKQFPTDFADRVSDEPLYKSEEANKHGKGNPVKIFYGVSLTQCMRIGIRQELLIHKLT
jgi:hypothetical protein